MGNGLFAQEKGIAMRNKKNATKGESWRFRVTSYVMHWRKLVVRALTG